MPILDFKNKPYTSAPLSAEKVRLYMWIRRA